ncbi:MAG: TonB-dependent receptor [Acidaminococcaceae bacterium]|nr:TonB-dependent receptor [Acidaminococcaceae bacterium]
MKESRKGLLMAALICGTIVPVLFGGTSVYAAEADDEALSAFELNPMVITAQRAELSDLDTPAGTTVVTAKEIENSGAKTAYEIIERQVGITNNAYGPGGREYGGSNTRTVLRGLDKGTVVMVNGAPINMLNTNSMEGIPAQAIEKIEIVRGAQSVLYGAEAFGGVINIITKKGGENKTTLSYGAGNFDQKWSVSTQGKGYIAYVSKDYYGKVNDTNYVGPKSNYHWMFRDSTKENAFVSISPIDKLSITAAHTKGKYYRDGMDVKNPGDTRHVAATKTKPEYVGDYSYLYNDARDNVSIAWDDQENQFKSIISYNRRKIDPYNSKIVGWQREAMKRNSSSNWKLETMAWNTQKGWDLRDGKDHLVVGLDLSKEKYTDTFDFAEKADRKNVAAFASYKYQFSDKFSTTLGVRGQHVSDYIKDENVFLPQIQTLYKFNDKTSWYINVGKSFQMPALNQYFNGDHFDELKPQKGWTYETGMKIINDSSSIKFDVFHMDIDGKFSWAETHPGEPKQLINTGKFKNTGVEVEYTKQLSNNLGYRLGVMWANPKATNWDTKLKKIRDYYEQDEAKLQLTAGVDYKLGKLTSNLNYLFIGNRENSYYRYDGSSGSTNPDHKVPNRSVLNANFIYNADTHHSIQLTLNNILGRDDTINKYENWSMPYNWMLTYRYTF